MQRLIGAFPALIALCTAGVLFTPYHQGWGCKPTPGSVALVLAWLLPVLGGLRALSARKRDKRVVIASYVLAIISVLLAVQGTLVHAITEQACR